MSLQSENLPLPATAVENDTKDNVGSTVAYSKTMSTHVDLLVVNANSDSPLPPRCWEHHRHPCFGVNNKLRHTESSPTAEHLLA